MIDTREAQGGSASRAVPWLIVLLAGLIIVVAVAMLLSTSDADAALKGLRTLTVLPEHRCSPYDRDNYRHSPSVEQELVNRMGGRIYSPYSGRYFPAQEDTDIEHIVATSEAHDSGLCNATAAVRSAFANDPDNLTLASPEVNRYQKSDKGRGRVATPNGGESLLVCRSRGLSP